MPESSGVTPDSGKYKSAKSGKINRNTTPEGWHHLEGQRDIMFPVGQKMKPHLGKFNTYFQFFTHTAIFIIIFLKKNVLGLLNSCQVFGSLEWGNHGATTIAYRIRYV